MQVETLNKAIMLLAAAFPGVTFNARLYEEMLEDVQDKYFLDAVYGFIKTTKEIYPGTNPLAILREKALSLVPSLPKPKRTAEELKRIQEMQEFYDRQKKEADELWKKNAEKKDMNKLNKKHSGRSPQECIEILKKEGKL